MKRIFWVYFALLLLGLIVLAWPEENNLMMIQLSEKHGPSKMDLAGILIIMMGYLPMVKEVWKQSPSIRTILGTYRWHLSLIVIFISMAGIVASLYADIDVLLWISIFITTLTQSVLVRIAYRSAV